MSLLPSRAMLAALLGLLTALSASAAEVHLRFFHSDCAECEKTREYLEQAVQYFDGTVLHDHPLEEDENYRLLMLLEADPGVSPKNEANAPVSVFLGRQAYYGFASITNSLPAALQAGLADGVPLYEPQSQKDTETLARERLASFTLASVLVNGLLDGINPCAFATLILFISLLSVYGSSKREMLLTGAAFTLAVFLTYLALGLGLLKVLQTMAIFPKIKTVFDWGLTIFCLVCAFLSLRDAYKIHRGQDPHDSALKLPPKLRDRITKIISAYAGRRRWLLGVALAGFLVSILESVCTGQVYIPTISIIIRNSPARLTAWLWLLLYNALFVLPLAALTLLAANGLKSRTMLKIQERGAVPIRLLMALLFIAMAALLVLR